MQQRSLQTKGMHCDGCASRIEQTLGRLEGVRRVRANHQAERVDVAFDEHEIDEAAIRARLHELGYELA